MHDILPGKNTTDLLYNYPPLSKLIFNVYKILNMVKGKTM
jgi:hypothetical protein